jgi:hypothetical protein
MSTKGSLLFSPFLQTATFGVVGRMLALYPFSPDRHIYRRRLGFRHIDNNTVRQKVATSQEIQRKIKIMDRQNMRGGITGNQLSAESSASKNYVSSRTVTGPRLSTCGRRNWQRNVRLFLGRVPAYLPVLEMRAYFQAYGKIERLDCIFGQQGQRRRFCFLEFSDMRAARKCLMIKHPYIGPYRVIVDRAFPQGCGRSEPRREAPVAENSSSQYAIGINRHIRSCEVGQQREFSKESSSSGCWQPD